jgi:hypothetical protein
MYDTVITFKTEKKRCVGLCGQELPLGRFHRHAGNKDGHANTCVDCRSRKDSLAYAEKKRRTRDFYKPATT